MNTTVTVVEVHDAMTKGQKPYKYITDENGQRWNFFKGWGDKPDLSLAWGLLVPGNRLELSHEQSGEYKNLTGAKFIDKVEVPKPVRPAASADDQMWTNARTGVMQIMGAYSAGKMQRGEKPVDTAISLCFKWMNRIFTDGVEDDDGQG